MKFFENRFRYITNECNLLTVYRAKKFRKFSIVRNFLNFSTVMVDVNQLKTMKGNDAVEVMLVLNISIFLMLQMHSTAGQQWM